MKLESLKSSKFEAFKEDEIKNPIFISGGMIYDTTWEKFNKDGKSLGSGTDQWLDYEHASLTSNSSTHFGTTGDMTYYNGPIGSGEDWMPELEDGDYLLHEIG